MDSIISTLGFILSVLVGLGLLIFLVVVHELGHAIAARRNGVVVEEFGIGFPPRAWSKMLKNGVLFTLNWLPLGGFVKLKGEYDAADVEGGYGASSLWVKTKILLAGVMVNFLTAAFIFMILSFVGLPKIVPGQFNIEADRGPVAAQPVEIARVNEGSPADKIGLKKGDKIVSLANEELEVAGHLSTLTRANAGKTVPITFEQDGKRQTRDVTLNRAAGSVGYLGVGPSQQSLQKIHATWSAPIVGFVTALQLSQATLEGLGNLLVDVGRGVANKFSSDKQEQQVASESLEAAGNSVTGPVGILGQIFPTALESGIVTLLFITALISLALAVMNILPIPALDGGRLFLTLIFRAMGKTLTKEREETIVGTSFLLLMALFIFITFLDLKRIF